MGAELAMYSSAAHAQEYSHLRQLVSTMIIHAILPVLGISYTPTGPSCEVLVSCHPSSWARNRNHVPGFLAPQSAQQLFPGTLLTKSCKARSLRACWRLLAATDIVFASSCLCRGASYVVICWAPDGTSVYPQIGNVTIQ